MRLRRRAGGPVPAAAALPHFDIYRKVVKQANLVLAPPLRPVLHFREVALMDLADLERNVWDGVHVASLAGAWIAAVAGFGGMRDRRRPADVRAPVPPALTRLRFRPTFCGRLLEVMVNHTHAEHRCIRTPQRPAGRAARIVGLRSGLGMSPAGLAINHNASLASRRSVHWGNGE